MTHSNISHRRTHNLLLVSKLLNQRDNVSPITIVLDSLEQPARPLLREYMRRAQLSRSNTIFLSFETLQPPKNADHFVQCWKKQPAQVLQEVKQILSSSSAASAASQRFIIFIDSLHSIASQSLGDLSFNLPGYLSSLIMPDPRYPKRQISVVATYHTDVPYQSQSNPYAPSPLAQLNYLATSIMTVHSIAHLLAVKAARDRSLPAPTFGLAEELEGVVIGLNSKSKTLKPEMKGLVIELEHRRKSGRGVVEWFFLPSLLPNQATPGEKYREHVTLLDDHPLFRKQVDAATKPEDELSNLTFDLSLTERQKQEREGVVLPYFDAQKAGGGGEGGRILYDMGVEDDFDDEEDED